VSRPATTRLVGLKALVRDDLARGEPELASDHHGPASSHIPALVARRSAQCGLFSAPKGVV